MEMFAACVQNAEKWNPSIQRLVGKARESQRRIIPSKMTEMGKNQESWDGSRKTYLMEERVSVPMFLRDLSAWSGEGVVPSMPDGPQTLKGLIMSSWVSWLDTRRDYCHYFYLLAHAPHSSTLPKRIIKIDIAIPKWHLQKLPNTN